MRYVSAPLLAALLTLAPGCGGGKSGGGVAATYTLSVTVSGGGSVNGDPPATSCSSGRCTTSQPIGTQVTLTAAPRSGWAFGAWSGACSGSGSCSLTLTSNRSVTATFTADVPPGANVLPLTVNGATCGSGAGNYLNKPCVRVTVCVPDTTPPTCQEVDDVLLDTGSYGLRVFASVLPFSLPLAAAGSATIAECIQYLDGSSHWGPVATADVVLGGEPSIQVPVQVIDATFGPAPSSCPSPETGPATAGFKGILGVGPFAVDCGVGCSTIAANGIYFACSGGTCLGTAVPLASQVSNPVASLPTDNNGVVVDLPPVALGGQLSIEGSLILGIDTQTNNASAGATAYPADQYGEIRTTLAGTTISTGFLDTGSNGLFFDPPATLPACPTPNQSWFCPAQTTSFSATNSGTGGTPSGPVSFSIGNALGLFATGNAVFRELGGSMPQGAGFDFGLPFFLGQKVFVGIEGTASTRLGPGPYYAY